MPSIIAIFSTLILGLLNIRPSDVLSCCKKNISSLCLRLYKRLKQGRLNFYTFETKGEPEELGFIAHPVEWQLETPQSESHLAGADDEIFFYGVNSKEECVIVSVSRLCNNKAEAKIYLRLASGKTFKLERNLDFQQSVGDKKTFSCGGLQIYTLRPMKRWRIFYSGYLKEISDETPDVHRMAYVKFSFLWRASSDAYDSTFDMDASQINEAVARADWKHFVPPVHKLFDALDFYAQGGVILGSVCVEGVLDDYEMYLFGEKVRFLGTVTGDELTSKEMEFSHTLGFVHENGSFLHFGQASITNIVEKMNYGFVVAPDGAVNKLEKLELSMKADSAADDKEEITGKFEAGRSYLFCGSITQPAVQTFKADKSGSLNQIKFFCNGKKGSGIEIKWKIQTSSVERISDIVDPVTLPECVYPMVTAFTEDLCQLSEITGGKGSSLGMLKVLSGKLQSFSVPTGVVVTTSSYKQFINADILNEIKRLEVVLYGNKDVDSKEACKRVHDVIMATKFPNSITENIIKNLKKLFGEDYITKKFAVRSSATGEDTEQMSAAGQMETFLGVAGLNHILSAVKKCWASQFAFTAVQYKRRYGQCLNTPMAVVIQEMVACDRAGVIFTCDPVSGYSNKMSIAANFGLGESVVSSAVEPDTIELIRDENDELRVNTVSVGSKNKKIVMTDDGTTQEDLPESQKQACCLTTEEILRLGDLAVQIEKNFRSKRDIEWGIQNNRIYIFQSRPVTSGTQETEFEIEHEFDSALRVENDYISVANAAEVLPGALPPLSLDAFLNAFHIILRGKHELESVSGVKTRYFLMGWVLMYNHMMFNVAEIFRKSRRGVKSAFEKATMVSVFGRVLDDDEVYKVIEDRFSEEVEHTSLKGSYKVVKCLLLSARRLEEAKKSYLNYRIPVEKYQTSKDLFNALLEHCSDLGAAFMAHMYCSQRSTMGNMLIFATLAQDKEELDNDVFTDFAKLVTMGGNTESADVPASIQNLVYHISKSIKPEEFKAMKTEEALRWLTDTSSPIGKRFTEFIKKHGHRCFKELDMYSPSWRSDPKTLVQLLQSKAGSVSREAAKSENPSVSKLLSEIQTPMGRMTRLKMHLFVRLCWSGVQGRESSKSLIVKGVDAWREGYWQLAKLMVSEGRIPNENILFFMPLEEVKELLYNRSPKILAKAYQRQRLFPKMNDYLFPEIMRGFPRPMNTDVEDNAALDENLSMQGVPVSQGIAKGYARVAVTIDEAAHLKPGEILVTYATDIGWSPYFPILAGVATELGGLISHGAVVSREYGLPCVAGLHGATRKFRTGDYVLLDGIKGVLKKIAKPE